MNHADSKRYYHLMNRLNHLTKIKYHLLSDGRILAYQEFGDRDGIPTFYCHTTSGSKVEGEFFDQAALDHGIRLICIDRPGIGDSSYLPKRTLRDYSNDLQELACELNITQFGLIGWTGGAAYALAVSHDIPEQVCFCIIIAGFCDFRSKQDFCDHLDSGIEKLIAYYHRKYPKMVRFYLNLVNITTRTFSQFSLRNMTRSISTTDQQIVSKDHIRSIILRAQQESFKEGSMGPTKEILIHYSDWGFNLKDIEVFVDIFHGAEDQIVPPLFSHHIKNNLLQSELNIVAKQGHFFPCINHQEIFSLAAKRANYYQTGKVLSKKVGSKIAAAQKYHD